MSILGLQKKTKTKQNSTLWSGLWVWYLHSIGRKKNFFKTQRDQQKDKMIVVNLSPAAAPREAGRPGAAPKTSMQRLTEPAKEPDAAVRDRKNGLRVGVCFLWLASAASVTPFSRFISKIWYEEFQENVCACCCFLYFVLVLTFVGHWNNAQTQLKAIMFCPYLMMPFPVLVS